MEDFSGLGGDGSGGGGGGGGGVYWSWVPSPTPLPASSDGWHAGGWEDWVPRHTESEKEQQKAFDDTVQQAVDSLTLSDSAKHFLRGLSTTLSRSQRLEEVAAAFLTLNGAVMLALELDPLKTKGLKAILVASRDFVTQRVLATRSLLDKKEFAQVMREAFGEAYNVQLNSQFMTSYIKMSKGSDLCHCADVLKCGSISNTSIEVVQMENSVPVFSSPG